MDKILKALEDNATLTPEQLAVMFDKEQGEIKDLIRKYEADGVILGYKAMIDWDKTDREYVTAMIEVKMTPQRDRGFDRVAEKIYNYPEVQSLYLMSGGFDLAVMLRGKTMREIAAFVASKLAVLDSVTATATHFVLQKYKENGVIFGAPQKDERGNCL